MTKSGSQIQGKVRLMAALLTTFVFHSSAVAISCDEWFEKLNLKRGSVSCQADCIKAADAVPVDDCSMYCRGMCVPDKGEAHCKLDPFWVKRLKASPEPFQTVVGDEQEAVTSALSKLPKSFRPSTLKAIVKGTKPLDWSAPSTEATSTDEFVILYPIQGGRAT